MVEICAKSSFTSPCSAQHWRVIPPSRYMSLAVLSHSCRDSKAFPQPWGSASSLQSLQLRSSSFNCWQYWWISLLFTHPSPAHASPAPSKDFTRCSLGSGGGELQSCAALLHQSHLCSVSGCFYMNGVWEVSAFTDTFWHSSIDI